MKTISIKGVESNVLASRETGLSFRVAIEATLQDNPGEDVLLDFSAVRNATQSCIDEMIGVLVLREGPGVLSRLRFHSCCPTVQHLIRFVVEDRIEFRQRSAN